ncbi:DNA-binding protein HU [Candidatus Gracilibacteria bacterium]|nr:DNA-binding protein HU [Candidatus Gracilibacteria bacterium]
MICCEKKQNQQNPINGGSGGKARNIKDTIGKILKVFIRDNHGKPKKGKEVNATGFGIFRVVKRKERMGVNPKTGKAMKIGSSVSVAWRVGKTLKEAIRKVIK